MRSLKRKLLNIIISCTILLSLIAFQKIQAPTNIKDIPLWKTRTPEFDGNIIEGPWRDGNTRDIILYNISQVEKLTISITAIHTANKTLYMGIKFPYQLVKNTTFICTLYFRTNQSASIWNSNDTLGAGHDIKEMTIDQNLTKSTRDLHTEKITGNVLMVEDSSNDIAFQYQNRSDGLSLEISIPFESSDVGGLDFNPRTQKKTDLFITAKQYNTTYTGNYSQYRFNDNDFDYCTIKYRGMRQGNFYILLIGIPTLIIASINVIRVIYTKKDKPE
jgi:hypothetical protein